MMIEPDEIQRRWARVGMCAFTFVVFPELTKVITVGYYGGPSFLFELTIGLWLLLNGIRPRTQTSR